MSDPEKIGEYTLFSSGPEVSQSISSSLLPRVCKYRRELLKYALSSLAAAVAGSSEMHCGEFTQVASDLCLIRRVVQLCGAH